MCRFGQPAGLASRGEVADGGQCDLRGLAVHFLQVVHVRAGLAHRLHEAFLADDHQCLAGHHLPVYGAWATFVTAKLRSFVFFDLTSPPMAIGAMVTLKVHWILPVWFGTNWAGSVSPL